MSAWLLLGLLLLLAGTGMGKNQSLRPTQSLPTPTSQNPGASACAVSLQVACVLQKPELPNGCEITSLAAVMQYWGYFVDKGVLSDTYLPKSDFYRKGGKLYGGDPEAVYPGDPRTNSGFYCYAAPIVQAAQSYIAHIKAPLHAEDLTGSGWDALCAQLNMGRPVLVWITQDGQPPAPHPTQSWVLEGADRVYVPYRNVHCVVLTGYTPEGSVLLCDPLLGHTSMKADAFLACYKALGQRAAVLYAP